MNTEMHKDDDESKVILGKEEPSAQPTPQEKHVQTMKYEKLLEQTNNPNYFQYPPNLDLAYLHREAQYLCPDKSIVDKQQLDSCPCCNKKINKRSFKWYWCDLYEEIVDDYGVVVPLYFTIIKFQLFIFVIVFCIYGIIFIIQVNEYCNQYKETCDTEQCDECQFSKTYYIVSIEIIKRVLESDQKINQCGYYQFACFFIFMLNLNLPFLYNLLISYTEIKYWHRDPLFRQTETKCSIYVRHLQERKQPQDIFDAIRAKIEKNPNYDISKHKNYDKLVEPMLKETIYLYDVNQLVQWQAEREQLLITIVLNQKEIALFEQQNSQENLQQALTKLDLNLKALETLNQNIQNEMGALKFEGQTSNILQLEPLKFSKKAIIKFTDQEAFRIVHENFKRTFFQDLCIKLKFIVHPKISDKIAVKKSFRINGIFWNNIGQKTIDRLHQKLHSLVVMLLACVALMVAYEFIFLYVNDPEFKINKNKGKLNTEEKFATNIFTILVPIITTSAILIVIINQKKARRTTLAHQERGYMHFLIVTNYWLVTFVPYLFTFEMWDGKTNILAIYNLISLTQNKLITKHIFHTLHIRFMTYLLRSRKAIKNYLNYFQGQLNQLVAPPFFPQRSRNCNALFALTITLCLIYVCPIIAVMGFVFNLYIYLFDRYTITHLYAIDKRFTLILMRHQIKVYSIAFYPIKIYLFMKIFWDYKWLIYAGVPIAVSISLLGIIFRKKIVNFILITCCGMEKKEPNYSIQETYSQSYINYLKSLRIEETNILSNNLLKEFQSQ